MFMQQDDNDLVVLLSSSAGCSLNTSPGKNWVENAGGLPGYICKVAKGVMKSGKSRSSAIAIAVSTIKRWAAGGDDVDAGTRAKAAKALAQWNALKAKNKAKKVVKASNLDNEDYIFLTEAGPFNTDIVRRSWNDQQSQLRAEYRAKVKAQTPSMDYDAEMVPYSYIKELWTDHLIVEIEGIGGADQQLAYVPYTVEDGEVTFEAGTPVEIRYIPKDDEDYSGDLSDDEIALLGDLLNLSATQSAYEKISALATKL